MKLNIVRINKLALLSAAVCAAMLAFSHNASACRVLGGINSPSTNVTFNDTHVVGTVTPAPAPNFATVANYINFMIGLGTGTSGTFQSPPHTQTITRSTNTFASLPNALVHGAVKGTSTTINLGAGGVYSYLFAKYDGPNQGSVIWYVGNLSGTVTIPSDWNGYGLSGSTLFTPGGQVPEGGATVLLFGAALGTLGMVRRLLTSSVAL